VSETAQQHIARISELLDDDDALPDRYTERAEATLAYRLMEYLQSLGVITKDHVCYLRWPPIELIEDPEAELKD
jgi:hypothetical protein